ncbi:hypothetical protein TNCV_4281971 [Trichonephila clavipes]|nr:hypothetical protein TNCV_4281971 [Trichonephila clavipes]
MLDKIHSSIHYHRRLTHRIKYLKLDQTPLALNDSSNAVNLHDNVESDLRVSLVNNELVGPYSATVLVALSSAPDHRPPLAEFPSPSLVASLPTLRKTGIQNGVQNTHF